VNVAAEAASSGSEAPDVYPSVLKRLIVGGSVIVAITSSAVVALRMASRQVEDRDVIDRRLAHVDQLRGHTRELVR
jgi:hypothetical protein